MVYAKKFTVLVVFLLLSTQMCIAQNFKYKNYSDESKAIKELESRYNKFCKVHEIGKSAAGKIIYALEIGTGNSKEKPSLLVIGGAETDDLAGSFASEFFAQQILEKASADSVKDLLNKFTLYVIPRLSADPLEGFFAKIKSIHKGNYLPDDQDRDGKKDEDPYNDINNDNVLSYMRVLDPDGDWIENPDDPMLLKLAEEKKGEIGKYQLLFEGIDDDKDGKVNEDPLGGVNINKNTTYNFKPYTDEGGLHPFITSELRALGEFLFDRPNIVAVFTFSYNNNFLDMWKFKAPVSQPQLGRSMASGRPGNIFMPDSAIYSVFIKEFAPLAKFKGDPQGNGDIPGWAFFDAGRVSLTAPAWAYSEIKDTAKSKMKSPGTSVDRVAPEKQLTREQLAFRWIRKNNLQNFLEWKEIKHPDFPNNKVEIGGFIPFVLNNPPEDSLKSVSALAYKLLYKIFKSLPDLNIDTPLVESLGNDVNRVTLTISNNGKLPTHTVIGRRVKALQSLLIKSKLTEGQKIASGKKITFIDDPIPGGGKVTRTFVIVGKGKVEFNIGSPSAGYKNISVQL